MYDPVSESWTTKTGMLYPVTEYASAVIGSKIYVIGGQDEFNDPRNLDVNQIYDTGTDSWSFGTPLSNAVEDSAACVTSDSTGSKIYLIGGQLKTGSTNIVQIYNPAKDGWSFGIPMPTARFGLAAASINNTIYAMGGTDHNILPPEQANAENELYTPTKEIPQYSPTPTPTSTVPELSLLTIPLLLSMMLTATGLLVYHKKHKMLKNL